MVILKKVRVSPFQIVSIPAIVIMGSVPALAAVYLTVEEAQQVIFPGESFTPVPLTLSEQDKKAIKDKGGLAVSKRQKVWRTSNSGCFIVDEVIGKHEFIVFAVGINPDGAVRQIEILSYREAYGFEVRQKKWRRQFVGKTSASPLELKQDIRNISGATLSCRHVTEGVKRTLALYEVVIKK